METIINAVFGPIQQLLQGIVSALTGANLVAQRGLNAQNYLGPVSWLGPGWEAAIVSALTGAALVAVVLAANAGYRFYLDIKQGVQWW